MEESVLHQKILSKLDGTKYLLDIGCGNGKLDVFLAKGAGIRIVGLDLSHEGFGHAKKKATAKGVEDLITCVKGNVYDIAFAEDEEFDAVSLIHTLHHIEDPSAGLKEARRVLKPKGKLLIVECIAEKVGGAACCTYRKPDVIVLLDKTGFWNQKVEMLGEEDGHEYALYVATK